MPVVMEHLRDGRYRMKEGNKDCGYSMLGRRDVENRLIDCVVFRTIAVLSMSAKYKLTLSRSLLNNVVQARI